MAGARPRLIWFRAIAADSSYTEFELIVAETPFILDRQDFLCLWAFCTTRLPELGWVGSLSRLCSCEGRWSPGAFITTFPYFPLLLPSSVPQSPTPFQIKLPYRRQARSIPQGTSAHSGPKSDGRSSVCTSTSTSDHAAGTRVGVAAPGTPEATCSQVVNDGESFIPAQDHLVCAHQHAMGFGDGSHFQRNDVAFGPHCLAFSLSGARWCPVRWRHSPRRQRRMVASS